MIGLLFIEENLTGDLHFTIPDKNVNPLTTIELETQIGEKYLVKSENYFRYRCHTLLLIKKALFLISNKSISTGVFPVNLLTLTWCNIKTSLLRFW